MSNQNNQNNKNEILMNNQKVKIEKHQSGEFIYEQTKVIYEPKRYCINYLNDEEIENFIRDMESNYKMFNKEPFVYGSLNAENETMVMNEISITMELENGIYSYVVDGYYAGDAVKRLNRNEAKELISNILVERNSSSNKYTMPKTMKQLVLNHEIEGNILPNDKVVFSLETLNQEKVKNKNNISDELNDLMVDNIKNIFNSDEENDQKNKRKLKRK